MNTFIVLSLLTIVIAFTKADPTTAPPTTQKGDIVTKPSESRTPEEIRQKIKEQVLALTESCKNAAKLPADQAKIASNQAIPKTEPERCFLECIYNGLNVTKDGKFNETAARALAKQRFANSADELTKANSMIEVCSKEVIVKDPNEKCVIGRLVRECFVKNGSKINFFLKP